MFTHRRIWCAGMSATGWAAAELVEDKVFADALRRVAEANGGQKITVFEILTAVGFILFSEHPADAVIMEVGLGGRFDATNVIPNPAVSLIMPISMDHEAYLGDTVEQIAAEKAGIIKRGCPVVIGQQPFAGAKDTLIASAEKAGGPLAVYGQDFLAFEEHGRMVYQDEDGLLDLPKPALIGRHQIANAAAAIKAVRMAGFDVPDEAVERGVANASWPARMQRLSQGKLVGLAPKGSEIWLDGGHNPGAGLVIAEALAGRDEIAERPLFMIAGMINTKDSHRLFPRLRRSCQTRLLRARHRQRFGRCPGKAGACGAGGGAFRRAGGERRQRLGAA